MTLEFPNPKATLNEYSLRPKRSFGQNFLCDQSLVEKIARCCGETPGTVVEIGAGLGGLTVCLLLAGHQVIAIERDRDMLKVLRKLQRDATAQSLRLQLLEADAKAVDFANCFQGGPAPHVLCGNLPYNLTGQLLRKATATADRIARAVFLVQLEVADRLNATTGAGAYGALSVFTQAAFTVKREFLVKRGAFFPQPGVDSAVISLTPRALMVRETREFQAVVSAAFAQRRKTLRNAWKGVLGAAPERVKAAADAANISLDARGETLSIHDFQRMSQRLAEP